MSDLISRADAIEAVLGLTQLNGRVPTDSVIFQIKALPSADAEFADLPDIPRYYYEKVVGNMAHEINMLKEQLESADAVHGGDADISKNQSIMQQSRHDDGNDYTDAFDSQFGDALEKLDNLNLEFTIHGKERIKRIKEGDND